jgi:hypothetical protein
VVVSAEADRQERRVTAQSSATESESPWPRCSGAAGLLARWLEEFAAANPAAEEMQRRLLDEAGVELRALVDHWVRTDQSAALAELRASGFVEREEEGGTAWEHPAARLPRVRVQSAHEGPRLALAVEDVSSFLDAHGLVANSRDGDPDSDYEEARCRLPTGELAIVARRGHRGFRPQPLPAAKHVTLERVRRALRERPRPSDDSAAVEAARATFTAAAVEVGRDRAVDEFFAAERENWMSRNAAGRWQFARQQTVGIGWANHDHHTYRSSRKCFRALLSLFTEMGFVLRERFYAGAEAGWGAQILEHPVSRVVIFADVDMAPEELEVDFAARDLPPRDTLSTIGLWCALHGSSIGRAGLHHLEAEFDYAQARLQIEAAGIGLMPPFTDLPMLWQAFTVAETWPVAPERVRALVERGALTHEQAARFLTQGAPGSHLEVLQRWDGFKGFNKTGVSAIIRATDARRAVAETLISP